MDLINIKTFLRVVEAGSFSRAADDLGYAQSTVTAQIQALEKEIGHSLFERIGRKNYLTDVGMEFLQYANDIQYILQKASAIGQQSDDVHISLRVGVLESLLFSTTLKLIPMFKKRYKNAHIYLKVGHAAELVEMLKQNLLDMVYISDTLNTDPALECCYKKKELMVFLSGANHECAKQSKVPMETVMEYPFIVTEPTGHCYNSLLALAAAAGKNLVYDIMVNDIGAIAVLLTDNKSVSFLPECSLERYGSMYNLTKLDVDIPEQVYFSQVLIRKSKWMSPAMEHYISIIRKLHPET